jgi:hypothetical protein
MTPDADEDGIPSAVRRGSRDEVLVRLRRALIVRAQDDPVEAYAKRRIATLLESERTRCPLMHNHDPRRLLLARLRTDPIAPCRPWKRDELYVRSGG